MRAARLASFLLLVASCGDFPEAGEPTTGDGAFPELVPLTSLREIDAGDSPSSPDADLRARAAALNARAEILRQGAP